MSITNYENQVAAKAEKEAVAQQEQQNRAAWETILATYPVASHAANYSMVRDYCGGVITLPKFEFLIANQPRGFTLDWADEKEKLLDQVIGLLEDPYGRRQTEFTLRSERAKMSHWSRQQLRARLADLQLKQQMSKKSATQLRQDLKEMRAAETAGQRHLGFPQLPERMYDSQSRSWKVVDREYLLSLGAFELRRLNRLYGPYLDDRLNGR